MNPVIKYLLFVMAFMSGILLLWYFRSVFLFIAISAILSLVNRPLADSIKRIKIRKFNIGNSWAALLVIIINWVVIITVLWFTIPLIGNELRFLSTVDIPSVIERVRQMLFHALEPFFGNNTQILVMVESQIEEMAMTLLDFGQFKSVVSSMFGFIGGLFVAAFSITFMTFFFLKEEGLLVRGILLFIPERYEPSLRHAMQSIRYLLRRYIIGVFIQTILVASMVACGFYIIGIGYNRAVVIGLISGLLNIIPYLGPLMGAFFGSLVGVIIYLQVPVDMEFGVFITRMVLLYSVVQLTDNIVFQPLIFSNSVKAHPLEIFIVILIAGYLAGIAGMFFAIPVYTILRVVAREFFLNYRLVQKLTGKL